VHLLWVNNAFTQVHNPTKGTTNTGDMSTTPGQSHCSFELLGRSTGAPLRHAEKNELQQTVLDCSAQLNGIAELEGHMDIAEVKEELRALRGEISRRRWLDKATFVLSVFAVIVAVRYK